MHQSYAARNLCQENITSTGYIDATTAAYVFFPYNFLMLVRSEVSVSKNIFFFAVTHI